MERPAEKRSGAVFGTRLPPALGPDAHKGEAGRCLCFVGSRCMPGAAQLVARAAQRGGAGLVRVACLDENLLLTVPLGAPEAVLVDLSEGDRPRPTLTGSVLSEAEDHAWLAGPGLGDVPRTRTLVDELLASAAEVPRVFDADALNVVAGNPERFADCRGPVILTPHPGEAGRLLGASIPRDDEGRVACARELAQRSRAVVCLKGHHSVVSDGRHWFVNRSGNPGMATAGAGDVLAGLLVAYLARAAAADVQLDAFKLACAAVHVHGRAGDIAATTWGQRALVASDLIAALGAAQLELEPM